MATLSERIRRFRQRVERDASAPPDEPENGGSSNGSRRPSAVVRRVRRGIERGQERVADVRRRGETDLKRVQDRIERRVVPIEHEAKESARETRLLGRTIVAPVSSRAQKAAEELQELRDEAGELRDQVSGPLEEQREELKAEVDELKDAFGGLNTDLDDLGTDVEQPLFFEAADDPDKDGDLFETIDDPLDGIEDEIAAAVDGTRPGGGSIAAFEADIAGGVEEDFDDL